MNLLLGLLHVAAIQYPIQGGLSPAELQDKVHHFIEKSKKKGAELVVFPELVALDLLKANTEESETVQLEKMAESYSEKYFDWISSESKKLGVIVLGSSFPRKVDGHIRNTAILAFPDGRVVLQDKLFLTPDERAWGWEQGHELKLLEDAKLGRFVITICYDSEFPEVSQKYSEFRPNLILIPSMTGRAGLNRVRFSAQARAVEHFSYVVVTGTVSKNRDHVGQALVVGPQDDHFPLDPELGKFNESDILVSALNLKKLIETRATAGAYPVRDSKQFPNPIKVCNEILKAHLSK